MKLKAITWMYTQDGVLHNKVVGIFTEEQLHESIEDIRVGFGKDKEVLIDKFDESCDNYYLSYDDEYKSSFYSSNYIVGELNL